MSSNKRNDIIILGLSEEKLTRPNDFLTATHSDIPTLQNVSCKRSLLPSFSSKSELEIETSSKDGYEGSKTNAKSCQESVLNKSLDSNPVIKPEKRRNLSLTRDEPPPLIHYLHDKEPPKIDDDNNSPPQLLPEVIVTRTKLQKEKTQILQDEASFKYSLHQNFQKIKRKSFAKTSFGNSTSDDQASNESHESFLPCSDTAQCSSGINLGILKRALTLGIEKYKKSKEALLTEKPHKMGNSPDPVVPLTKVSTTKDDDCFSAEMEQQKKNVASKGHSSSKTDETDKDEKIPLKNSGNGTELRCWLTETEDDDEEDIFVVPQHISTGKEERDTIDGIEFLGFETERDMVEFTKIEIDFHGGNQNEEKGIHSDDGLDMMDDSFTYSEAEAQTSSQAIVPTKTKDITKIKGWRTKKFAINNNPTDGQCSSNIGPYDDDDGFVSCDVKIEYDGSLEQGDLWSGGEQDLLLHDNQFAADSFSSEESLKKTSEEVQSQNNLKTNKEEQECNGFNIPITDSECQQPKEDQGNEDISEGNRRYPKRQNCQENVENTFEEECPISRPDSPKKVSKKRGRKPKCLGEKKLSTQFTGHDGQKRKRGRPKGSVNKVREEKASAESQPLNDVGYNLRNSSRNFNYSLDDSKDEFDSDVEVEFKREQPVRRRSHRRVSIFSKIKYDTSDEESFSSYDSSYKNGNGKPLKSIFEDIHSSSEEVSPSSRLLTKGITELARSTESSYETSKTVTSGASIQPYGKACCPSMRTAVAPRPTASTVTTVTPSHGIISVPTEGVCADISPQIPIETEERENAISLKKKVTLSEKSNDKVFKYGLLVTTGVRRPLLPLAMEQLRILRYNNDYVDENWARFSVSVVLSRADVKRNHFETSTITLGVKSQDLPFMSLNKVPNFGSHSKLKSKTLFFESRSVPVTDHSTVAENSRLQVAPSFIPNITKGQKIDFTSNKIHGRMGKKLNACGKEQVNPRYTENSPEEIRYPHFSNGEIEDSIKKVVEDLVSYVERSEDTLVIHEDPSANGFENETQKTENVVMKKKKGPMIRELSRLDVNVIETWDAKNKKCTEEHCKLGCICESLACCRPAIEEHCGKEECMFNCECEQKYYRKEDNRQHSLLCPLPILTMPQQNRRVLAKEEKEFQQTVIRAKDETIVVGSNGGSRRKREIKLPGRYRDSYVALGKEYGLVHYNISSDEDTSVRRMAKISVVNNRDLIQDIAPKFVPSTAGKISKEMKLNGMKLKYNIKECFIRLERPSKIPLPLERYNFNQDKQLSTLLYEEKSEVRGKDFRKKSRNVALKSTTLLPNKCHNLKISRSPRINYKLLNTFKNPHSQAEENKNSLFTEKHETPRNTKKLQTTVLDTNGTDAQLTFPYKESDVSTFVLPCPSNNIPLPSDETLDDSSESFGKIECVTSLSEEQFERGDLSFGIHQFKTDNTSSDFEATKIHPSSEKSPKSKTGSNLSVNKITTLLNKKMRELKETGGSITFPTNSSNEESIHLLQWYVLKNLFQTRRIQLWYFKGRSKLLITSTKSRPEHNYVNLNDLSPQDHRNLPSLILDLFKINKKIIKSSRDVYALLHFDGRHVELVGTIFKKKNPPDASNVPAAKASQLKGCDEDNEESFVNTIEREFSLDENASTSSFNKHLECDSIIKPSDANLENIMNEKQISGIPFHSNVLKQKEDIHTSAFAGQYVNGCQDIKHSNIDKTKFNESVSNSVLLSSKSSKPLNTTDTEKNAVSCPSMKSSAFNSICEQLESNINKGINTLVSSSDYCSETRVRKSKTVWQTTKLQTSSGERVPVPLPSCSSESRWFVLSLSKPFDQLRIASKQCLAKHKDICASVRMSLLHKKTVRLPLKVTTPSLQDANQQKFGIYTVPNISSFVFVGPFDLHEDAGISKLVVSNGKLTEVVEGNEDCLSEEPKEDQSIGNQTESLEKLLKRLCKPSGNSKNCDSWLYAKGNAEHDPNNFQLKKQLNVTKEDSKNAVKENTLVSNNSTSIKEKVGKSSNENFSKETSTDISGQEHSTDITVISENVSNDVRWNVNNLHFNTKSLLSGDNKNVNDRLPFLTKSVSTKRKAEEMTKMLKKKIMDNNVSVSLETMDSSVPSFKDQTFSPYATLSSASVNTSRSHISKTSLSRQPKCKLRNPAFLESDQQNQRLVDRWLVPSFPWIGCIPCKCDAAGELTFSHPVFGVKMAFRNLESAQLWLERLFQTTILHLPKELSVKWSLSSEGEDAFLDFNSSILNGSHLLTQKGIFDIGKLTPTKSSTYGLKPIEVVKLKEKKNCRDLELGFFQLKRALHENGNTEFSSKCDLLDTASREIDNLKTRSYALEKEIKKYKNMKHKSLHKLYIAMKGLSVEKKRQIVQNLKKQTEQFPKVCYPSLAEMKDPKGLTYSMARYCVNSSVFGGKSDDSDLEDYLSENDEEIKESSENTVKKDLNDSQKCFSYNDTLTGIEISNQSDEQININNNNNNDDDESVSISVVTETQRETEEMKSDDKDEVTVTCLRDTGVAEKTCNVSRPFSILDNSLSNSSLERAVPTLCFINKTQPVLISTSIPTKSVNTISTRESNKPVQTKRKRTVTKKKCSGDLLQRTKVQKGNCSLGLPSVEESSHFYSGFGGSLIRKEATQNDSIVHSENDLSIKEMRDSTDSESALTNKYSDGKSKTLFVNVVKDAKKIVSVSVDDLCKSVKNVGNVTLPSTSVVSSRETLKTLPKPVFVKAPHSSVPFIATNHQMLSSAVPTSNGVFPQNLPVLKRVPKESIPPGVEPRLTTLLPPPLVPIDKKQIKSRMEQVLHHLTPIAPKPTFIVIPSEKRN